MVETVTTPASELWPEPVVTRDVLLARWQLLVTDSQSFADQEEPWPAVVPSKDRSRLDRILSRWAALMANDLHPCHESAYFELMGGIEIEIRERLIAFVLEAEREQGERYKAWKASNEAHKAAERRS